jgi:acetyl-CoA carboxylase carboxyl transferase subunit beta
MWVRCAKCQEMLYTREWEGNFKVCQKCGFHARLTARERIELLLDPESFEELGKSLRSADPLNFAPEGRESYRQKLEREMATSGMSETCIYGRGKLDEIPVVLSILDMSFFVGSLGSVVGEKIARACELALEESRPLVICSASGGARQQEGVVALLQMAKTSAAVRRLGRARLPFVSVLTDPTLAGVTASFAALGDCIIAEPGAVIGFAGPRIIEQATGEKLPPDADTAEFQLAHGMVDMVVPRRELREVIAKVLRLHLDAAVQARENIPLELEEVGISPNGHQKDGGRARETATPVTPVAPAPPMGSEATS